MSQASLLQLIKAPLITEKSSSLEVYQQYQFKVALKAGKLAIAQAIERLFKVKVLSVRTCRVRGKIRHFRRFSGRNSDWKKAYVTLAEGNSINFNTVKA